MIRIQTRIDKISQPKARAKPWGNLNPELEDIGDEDKELADEPGSGNLILHVRKPKFMWTDVALYFFCQLEGLSYDKVHLLAAWGEGLKLQDGHL